MGTFLYLDFFHDSYANMPEFADLDFATMVNVSISASETYSSQMG